MILSVYLDGWMDAYIIPRRATSTAQGYAQALRHLTKETLTTELHKLQPMMMQREVTALWARYPRQGQILFAVLHCALGRAERLGLTDRNVMRAVDKPEHKPRKPAILTTEQLRRYVRHARADTRAGAALVLMSACGLRRGEALGYTREDTNWNAGTIRVERQRRGRTLLPCKTERSRRELPVGEWLIDYLRELGPGPVCELSETQLTNRHKQLLQRAGLPAITPHGLRHSCATGMIAAGATIVQVQHYLGHANYETTDRAYVHQSPDILRPAAKAINDALLLS